MAKPQALQANRLSGAKPVQGMGERKVWQGYRLPAISRRLAWHDRDKCLVINHEATCQQTLSVNAPPFHWLKPWRRHENSMLQRTTPVHGRKDARRAAAPIERTGVFAVVIQRQVQRPGVPACFPVRPSASAKAGETSKSLP